MPFGGWALFLATATVELRKAAMILRCYVGVRVELLVRLQARKGTCGKFWEYWPSRPSVAFPGSAGPYGIKAEAYSVVFS